MLQENFKVGIIFGFIGALGMLGFVGWFYYIIKGLSKKIAKEPLRVFRRFHSYFLLVPVLYMLLVFAVLPYGFTISSEGSSVGTIAIAIIVPLHLFSMFCIFFMMYSAAKTIKTLELQRKVTFADFAGEFFLLWFFPVGIWIVQPKINKFAE